MIIDPNRNDPNLPGEIRRGITRSGLSARVKQNLEVLGKIKLGKVSSKVGLERTLLGNALIGAA